MAQLNNKVSTLIQRTSWSIGFQKKITSRTFCSTNNIHTYDYPNYFGTYIENQFVGWGIGISVVAFNFGLYKEFCSYQLGRKISTNLALKDRLLKDILIEEKKREARQSS